MADSAGQQHQSGTPPGSPSAAMAVPDTAPAAPPSLGPGTGAQEASAQLSVISVDFRTDTPKKPKRCNCRNSQCLKLYCECFAAGSYCNGCNCSNCSNNIENENKRKSAIDSTLLRNPDAFKPKIKSGPVVPSSRSDADGKLPVVAKHHKGCHCKKSGCLKKYCECFEMQVLCSKACKCIGCKNFEGSEDRQGLLLQGENGYQTSNVAQNGLVGNASPLKKRKRSDDLLGAPAAQQGRYLNPLGITTPCAGLGCSINYPLARSSKMKCPLADIIRPEHVRDLCTLLVTECREAERAFNARSENREEEVKVKAEENGGSSLSNSIMGKRTEAPVHPEAQDEHHSLNTNVADGADAERQRQPVPLNAQPVSRPASPTTLALMCDEEDTVFAEPSRTSLPPTSLHEERNGVNMELYAEQERRVLVLFRDTLCRLSTAARIRENQSSSAAMNPEAKNTDVNSSN